MFCQILIGITLKLVFYFRCIPSAYTSAHAEMKALGIRLEGYDILAAKKNGKLNSETMGLEVYRILRKVSLSELNVRHGSTAPNVGTPHSVNSDTVLCKEL